MASNKKLTQSHLTLSFSTSYIPHARPAAPAQPLTESLIFFFNFIIRNHFSYVSVEQLNKNHEEEEKKLVWTRSSPAFSPFPPSTLLEFLKAPEFKFSPTRLAFLVDQFKPCTRLDFG